MKTRMQPIGMVWNKLPRVVRDLAQAVGKKIRVEMDGAETELDKSDHRGDQGPADPHRPQLLRPRHRDARRSAPCRGKPADGTPQPARLPRRRPGQHRDLRRRRRHRHAAAEGEGRPEGPAATRTGRRDARPRGPRTSSSSPACPPRRAGHQHLRPRRRHGRGEDQHREDRRPGRRRQPGRRRHDGQDQDPADARHHSRAGRAAAAASGSSSRRSACSNCVRLEGDAGRAQIERIQGTPVYRRRGQLLPIAYLHEVLRLDAAAGHRRRQHRGAAGRRTASSVWSWTRSTTRRRSSSSRWASS